MLFDLVSSLRSKRLTTDRLKLLILSALVFVGTISYVSIKILWNQEVDVFVVSDSTSVDTVPPIPEPPPPPPRLSARIERLKELESLARHYVNTAAKPWCTLPQFNVMSVKNLEDKINGTCGPTHTEFDAKNCKFTMKCPIESHVPMYRAKQHSYTSFSSWDWKIFPYVHGDYIHIPDLDLIQTACVDLENGTSYHNYHVQVVKNEKLIKKRTRSVKKFMKQVKHRFQKYGFFNRTLQEEDIPKKPVDILVIVIDAVSRAFFQRHFPHTKLMIEQLFQDMPSANYSIVELKNYHVLDWNSYPNMHAFATSIPFLKPSGSKETVSWVSKLRVDTGIKTIPLLWDYLKKFGYVTSVGEDAVDSNDTAGSLYGYRDGRLTYDVYPAYNRVAFQTEIQGHKFNYISTVCPCVGNRFMSSVVYEFGKSFLHQYSQVPKFMLSVQDEAHDEVGNQVLALDPDLAGYIKWLKESGRLDHTAVVLMADHGLHYGPIYRIDVQQAVAEHESPFAYIMLPNRIARYTKIFSNANKLINIKDIHMTIRDIASFPIHSTKQVSRKDALSLLFDEVPERRTCEDMLVQRKHRKTCKRL